MAQQSVTISLPAEVVREARHLAVDKGLSLSKFLALLLEKHIEEHQRYQSAREQELQSIEQTEKTRRYEAAREEALKLMKKGLPLGTQGKISWTGDELHER